MVGIAIPTLSITLLIASIILFIPDITEFTMPSIPETIFAIVFFITVTILFHISVVLFITESHTDSIACPIPSNIFCASPFKASHNPLTVLEIRFHASSTAPKRPFSAVSMIAPILSSPPLIKSPSDVIRPSTRPIMASITPPNISLIPSHAFSQSPENTPVRKSIIPEKAVISPSKTDAAVSIRLSRYVPIVSSIGATTGSMLEDIQLSKGFKYSSHITLIKSATFPISSMILLISGCIVPSYTSENLSASF